MRERGGLAESVYDYWYSVSMDRRFEVKSGGMSVNQVFCSRAAYYIITLQSTYLFIFIAFFLLLGF